MLYKKETDAFKRKKPNKKLYIILALALLLVACTVIFFVSGLAGKISHSLFPTQVPTPYQAEGEVLALTLAAASGANTEEDLRSYYQQAVAFAQENGLNTLVVQAKKGLSVYWQDKNFPSAVNTEGGQSIDPLAILCEEADGKDLQIILAIDPYESGNYTSSSKGAAVKLASQYGALTHTRFSPADEEYTGLLLDSLTELPQQYPLAGVLLQGLEKTQSDGAATAENSEAIANLATSLRQNWQAKSLPTVLCIDTAGGLEAEKLSELATGGTVEYLFTPLQNVKEVAAALSAYGDEVKTVAALPEEDTGLLLYTASRQPGYSGAVLGNFATPQLASQVGLLKSALVKDEGEMPEGFTIPRSLSVTYPSQGARINTATLFVMGTSNPDEPLYLNGEEITNRAENGAFGVAVEVVEGSNSYPFTQPSAEFTLTVQQGGSGGGSSGGGGSSTSDTTVEVEPGTVVRVTTPIASALTNAHEDASINETLVQGATFVVAESMETTRSGRSTWAYRMPSGDWVLARNCERVSTEGAAVFTGISAEEDEKGEWLHFEGEGTPAAYIAYGNDDGSLKLSFYDTNFTIPSQFTSTYVSSASVETTEDGATVLTLTTKGIWGYSLEYEDGKTKLYLKKPPVRSDNPMRPLEGVHILLDPGHGDSDIGAAGLMGGQNRPNEKDLNLTLAKAIAYRLRQLGATVTMTREGDKRVSLEDRLVEQTLQKPDFFLSVHHNSMELDRDLNDISGAQAYYFHPYNTPTSKTYAQNLLDRIAGATGRQGGEASWSYYYVTRTTVCPSVLFEYGFVVNPHEFEDVASTEGIHAAAFATADGILETLPAANRGSNDGTASNTASKATSSSPVLSLRLDMIKPKKAILMK